MEAPFGVMMVLLVIELALLVVSVILLYLSRREHWGREALLEAILRATRELTRYEYFSAVIDAILSSRREVAGIATGRKPVTTVGREAVARILDAIRRASSRGVRIRYILYPSPERVGMAVKYREAGAEVRLHPYAGAADARYTVIDGELVLIGIASTREEEGRPTRMGYVIRSASLARILLDHYEKLWREAVELEEYVEEVVKELYEKVGDVEAVSHHLGLPVEFVREHLIGREGANGT